jgi:hypothetical protein
MLQLTPKANKIFPVARMWHDDCFASTHSYFLDLVASHFPESLSKIIITKDAELQLGILPVRWQAASCFRLYFL